MCSCVTFDYYEVKREMTRFKLPLNRSDLRDREPLEFGWPALPYKLASEVRRSINSHSDEKLV